MLILDSHVMRAAEQALFKLELVPPLTLMDKAIERLTIEWHKQPRANFYSHCLVYAGHGNNAGDALGLARALGLPCTLIKGNKLSEETRTQFKRLQKSGLLCPSIPEAARVLIIDGLLGTGATGPLKEPIAGLIADLNAYRLTHPSSYCLAIDIPSGLESEGDCCVHADMCATIGSAKRCLFHDAATPFVGEILPIPLPEVGFQNIPPKQAYLNSWASVQASLARRDYECYKNKAGHVHIIAGSVGYLGAAQLAAEAALRSGAGLVTLYALPEIYPLLAIRLAPEIILRRITSYDEVDCSKAQALLIGPGLGVPDEEATRALSDILRTPPCPLILDADGLKLMVREKITPAKESILTPHEGEMRYLAGAKAGSRLDWARSYIAEHPCTILLKGARSIIASETTLHYNSTGGPYMANAGQGDCLAGCIASLRAQGLSAHAAASAGAWICGKAAAYAQAKQQISPHVSAAQVIEMIPSVMGDLYAESPATSSLKLPPYRLHDSSLPR